MEYEGFVLAINLKEGTYIINTCSVVHNTVRKAKAENVKIFNSIYYAAVGTVDTLTTIEHKIKCSTVEHEYLNAKNYGYLIRTEPNAMIISKDEIYCYGMKHDNFCVIGNNRAHTQKVTAIMDMKYSKVMPEKTVLELVEFFKKDYKNVDFIKL